METANVEINLHRKVSNNKNPCLRQAGLISIFVNLSSYCKSVL